MDWFKNFITNLPLDDISENLSGIVKWWSTLVQDIPADDLPLYVYVGGSLIVLLLWIFVTRVIPKPFGGMSWVMLFALLLTPGATLDHSGSIAPASISVVHSLLLKEWTLAMVNLVPILFVIAVGFFLGFIWQVMLSSLQSEQEQSS